MNRRLVPNPFSAALVLMGLVWGFHAEAVAQENAGTDPVEERLKARNAQLDSLLNPESLKRDTTGLGDIPNWDTSADSLFEQYPDFGEKRGLRFSMTLLSFSTYNRVEGQRMGIGAKLVHRHRFDAGGAAGYSFKAHRWSGFGRVTVGGMYGPGIRLEAEDRVAPFGPNRIEYAAGLLSLIAGQDRQDYLHTRGGGLTVFPVRRPEGNAWIAAFHREQLSEVSRADFSVFGGGTPMEDMNPAIDRGRTRSVAAGGQVTFRQNTVEMAGEAGVAGGGLGGDFDYSWQTGKVTVRPIFPDGGVLSLSVEGSRVGGTPPTQALPYLGGDGNLRGYARLEFSGTSRVTARIEYATGIDLLGRTGVAFLRNTRLQFIPFFDSGTTWGDESGVGGSRPLDGRMKSSAGLGFRRELWVPGIQAVRFDVIRRLDDSSDPWGFWFRILPLQ